MPPIEPIDSTASEQSLENWYLVTVRSKKREVFLKFLNLAISQNQLQDLVIEIKSPQDAVYQDIVLLKTSNFKNAYIQLKKVECFQNIERKPLALTQVNRMLGIG
ncbi:MULTISPECIES: chromosome segregation ATPase [unclassified Anabaena]|uniref:chromosome segregation ATPase n=1 Tax=unclassified Anabaena TaxID=2619674 RepID=UPI00144683FB|nr:MULTISPECIES: chromosome segregation ATPase [unclassified Anabaena]MTJ06543.1 chromosome segregation ATPase [Anabaena sp. UHCC 0204]MTJ54315.1 chromosome segregation ATPase [Anabaena sp. UHCC 0253]